MVLDTDSKTSQTAKCLFGKRRKSLLQFLASIKAAVKSALYKTAQVLPKFLFRVIPLQFILTSTCKRPFLKFRTKGIKTMLRLTPALPHRDKTKLFFNTMQVPFALLCL